MSVRWMMISTLLFSTVAMANNDQQALANIMGCKSQLILEADKSLTARLQQFAKDQRLRTVRISNGVIADQSIARNTQYLRQTGDNSFSTRLLDEKGVEVTTLDLAKAKAAADSQKLSADVFLDDKQVEGRTLNVEVQFDLITKEDGDESTGQQVLVNIPVSMKEVRDLSKANLEAAATLEGDIASIVAISAVDSIPDEVIAKAHEGLLAKLKSCQK